MEVKHAFNICRLCLSESESFIEVFEMNECFGYVAAEVITDLLRIPVSETDGYPHMICSMCLEKLSDLKQFKQQCLNSIDTYDNVFMSYESDAEHPIDIDEQNPVKLEPRDPLDTREEHQEVSSASINRDSEEGLNQVDATNEIRGTVPESVSDAVEGSEEGKNAPLGEKVEEREHFKCHNCSKGFGKKDSLIKHFELNDCVANGKSSCEERVSEVNANVKNGSKCGTSEIRKKRLYWKWNMSDNVKRDKETGKYDCCICGKCGISAIARHLRVHSGEKPFPCTVCGKSFGDKFNLGKHALIHADGKLCVCEECGKSFVYERELVIHRRIHSGGRVYVCEVCGKLFSRANVLMRHRRVHSGDKPYTCEVCGKGFSQSGSLTTHRRVHSGEKPYKCQICDKRVANRSNFMKHVKMHLRKIPGHSD